MAVVAGAGDGGQDVAEGGPQHLLGPPHLSPLALEGAVGPVWVVEHVHDGRWRRHAPAGPGQAAHQGRGQKLGGRPARRRVWKSKHPNFIIKDKSVETFFCFHIPKTSSLI